MVQWTKVLVFKIGSGANPFNSSGAKPHESLQANWKVLKIIHVEGAPILASFCGLSINKPLVEHMNRNHHLAGLFQAVEQGNGISQPGTWALAVALQHLIDGRFATLTFIHCRI